jgi:hypothetical protein
MFLFLRKLRRSLIEGGDIGRYLRYALGEILLVVVGILIALQIDSWNDDRLDRQQEREYLASMLDDLSVDARRIDEAVAGNTVLLAGLDDLLELLRAPVDSLVDDIELQRSVFLHALVRTYWYLRADFSELTMAQLKSSGGLLLITDRSVRDAMLTYEQGLEVCKNQYLEMTNYFHVMEDTQKRLFDLRLGRRAFELIEEDFRNMLLSLERFEPLVPQGDYLLASDATSFGRYYGDVLFYRTALAHMNVFLQDQKRLGENLAGLIRETYGLP